MYEHEPVLIPDVPGRISFRKKNGSEYVQYVTRREYDRIRKHTLPERKIIGIRIPSIPEMMLPNDNYFQYFTGDGKMNEEQKAAATHYAGDKQRFIMLRELFDQMYYEFQLQSRRKQDEPVNAYKAMKINSILAPLREMMAEEEYATYLDLVDVAGKEGDTPPTGRTYSDVALLLTQYKGAMKRYSNEKL